MRERPAIAVAVVAAPAVPGALLALCAAADPSSRWAAVPLVMVDYQLSLLLVACVGLPVFLALRQLNCLRWWTALICGVPFGLAMSFAIEPAAASIWNHLVLGFVGDVPGEVTAPTQPFPLAPPRLASHGLEIRATRIA